MPRFNFPAFFLRKVYFYYSLITQCLGRVSHLFKVAYFMHQKQPPAKIAVSYCDALVLSRGLATFILLVLLSKFE